MAVWDDDVLEGSGTSPSTKRSTAKSLDVPKLGGEKGFSALERLWVRPTCDVNGILCGYTGEGAKTVLPGKAMAKISFRLVPDQTPERVKKVFEAHVKKVAPAGVTVDIEALHGGRPWRTRPQGKLVEAAGKALEKAFGVRPVLQGEGGSIPIVVDFEEQLNASALLVGFALPGCNLHAPNEWFELEAFEKGIRALCLLYENLA